MLLAPPPHPCSCALQPSESLCVTGGRSSSGQSAPLGVLQHQEGRERDKTLLFVDF